MRLSITGAGAAGALALAGLAAPAAAADAAEQGVPCPPHAFCERRAAPPPEDAAAPAAPGQEAKAQPETITVVIPSSPDDAKPRVIVIEPDPAGGPPRVIEQRGESQPAGAAKPCPSPDQPEPEPAETEKDRRWGIALRGSGLLVPDGHEGIEEVSLGGVGVSLRYRPVPAFALDFSLDVLGGTDPDGENRIEVPLGISGLVFPFPRGVVQPYLVFGLHASQARVGLRVGIPHRDNGDSGDSNVYADSIGRDSTYLGGQAGVGLELRLASVFGLHADTLGFIRGRVGDGADWGGGGNDEPEAGGLIRGGVSFWW
ncbi:MAG: hypothetical protein HY744_32560 [Deltaproteobacteria bacterium]|nr:hypothetical protein [Deltaproteobacteria bacterium]